MEADHSPIEFKDFLESFSYKEGWRFTIQEGTGKLLISTRVRCTRSAGDNQIHISLAFPIPKEGTVDSYMKFVRESVLTIETHEMDEWLWYKGGIYADPH